jgi:predicted ATPase
MQALTSLVGRDSELSRLEALIEATGSGAEAVAIVGQPSIGKSALIEVGHVDTELGDSFAVALATLDLLRDRTSPAPLLIAVEDLHWLDQATVEVLDG